MVHPGTRAGQGHGPRIDAAMGYAARATSLTPLRRALLRTTPKSLNLAVAALPNLKSLF